jgi:predicted DNA repair protein MutK
MDDVVVMSKIATKKNSGNIRDDLAVNAEKHRFVLEKPVLCYNERLFLNKLIILPLLFVKLFVPWLITVKIYIGAIYSAFEGAEKYTSILFLTNKRLLQ